MMVSPLPISSSLSSVPFLATTAALPHPLRVFQQTIALSSLAEDQGITWLSDWRLLNRGMERNTTHKASTQTLCCKRGVEVIHPRPPGVCTRVGARSVQCSPSPVTNGASQTEGSPRPLLGTPWSPAALCPRLWGCQRGVWGSHRQRLGQEVKRVEDLGDGGGD